MLEFEPHRLALFPDTLAFGLSVFKTTWGNFFFRKWSSITVLIWLKVSCLTPFVTTSGCFGTMKS